jgi:hypothetical protein
MIPRMSACFVIPALAIVGSAFLFHATGQVSHAKKAFPPIRFQFEFAPDTSVADLLPKRPNVEKLPTALIEDAAQAPELALAEPLSKDAEEPMRETAHLLAKINQLNKSGQDAFLKELLADRSDLRGLPFVMGQGCRTSPEQSKTLAVAVRRVREAMFSVGELASKFDREKFWTRIDLALEGKDSDGKALSQPAGIDPAMAAALWQMITPMSPVYGPELPKRLARIGHPDAGKALAKLALFAPEEDVRMAAIASLKSRGAAEYVDVLLDGFRYPLPAVSDRAASALTQLDRKEVARKLVDVLEAPDPRAPQETTVDGKKVTVVRELVRVNHHRNCALCHAPANVPDMVSDAIQGEVPMPNERLGTGSLVYGFGRSPDIMVRIDVSYLRQDFSLALPVKNSAPWPVKQRFDFLVRTREVSPDEAKQQRDRLAQGPQPYQRAALTALRALTGRDAASPNAWRELLN